jgi:alpha-glucosidase
VPLPWTPDGSSFGFGSDGAHLPQPDWFGAYSVLTEQNDAASTLSLYRQVLALRRQLVAGEALTWIDDVPDGAAHFRRDGAWDCVTNFSSEPVPRPDGHLVAASGPLEGHPRQVPPWTTLWLRP